MGVGFTERSGNEIECGKCGYYLNVGEDWEWTDDDKLICPQCRKGHTNWIGL